MKIKKAYLGLGAFLFCLIMIYSYCLCVFWMYNIPAPRPSVNVITSPLFLEIERDKNVRMVWWYEKKNGQPLEVVVALGNVGNWDKRLAICKSRFQFTRGGGNVLIPVGDVENIILRPDKVKLFRFDISVNEADNIGVYKTEARWYHLLYCTHIFDRPEPLISLKQFGLNLKRVEPISIGRGAWQPEKFVVKSGEQIEINCYLTNLNYTTGKKETPWFRVELYKNPSGKLLGCEVLDCGGAKLTEQILYGDEKYVLDYGLMPKGKVDRFKLKVQLPEVKRLQFKHLSIWHQSSTLQGGSWGSGGGSGIDLLVVPEKPYQQTILDKIASHTIANVTKFTIFKWVGYILLAAVAFTIWKLLRKRRFQKTGSKQG